MTSKSRKLTLLTIVGWVSIIAFFGIYIVELLPHHGQPITIKWIRETFGTTGLIIINIVIVLAFLALLPYRRPTKSSWKSKGAFIAFVIALMTEMFGWPLFLFLLSPMFDIPKIAPDYFRSIGHWPSIITLIIWPVLLGAYYWLARFEEKMAIEDFGEEYITYMKSTKRFVPYFL